MTADMFRALDGTISIIVMSLLALAMWEWINKGE